MDEETTVDLHEIYDVIRKRIWIIVVITLTAAFISGILSFFVIKPVYEARTSVIVGRMLDSEDSRMQYNDVMMYQNLIKTYVEIAKSRTVCQNTIDKLGMDIKAEELLNFITVSPVPDTQMINIKVLNKDANQAADIANTITEIFIKEARVQFPGGSVSIMDKAVVPEYPSKPNKKLNVAAAFLLGLMMSIVVVFLVEYLDKTIKNENDVEKYINLPVIGMIPKIYENQKKSNLYFF